jgi:hypothetical protein
VVTRVPLTTLLSWGWIAFTARDYYRQALAVRRQASDRHGEAEILRDLGDLSRDAGHARTARQSWGQALAIMEDLDNAPACADLRGRLDRPGLTGT